MGVMDQQAIDDVRAQFTKIGCIMEDASVTALIWDAVSSLTVDDRYQRLLDAHRHIQTALKKIKSAIQGG